MPKLFNFIKSRIRKYLFEEVWLKDYKKLGMKIGDNCSIQAGVTFDYSFCWLINIGNNVTIGPEAYILAHDASTIKELNFTKVGSITIEDNVFIGARALILPGVTIGKNSIVAAGSIVTKTVPENSIVAGNPAKVITSKDEYLEKNKMLFKESYVFEHSYIRGNDSGLKKEKVYSELKNKIGYLLAGK
ncbi:maltose O-acetyltransferase [Neobacillus niacini]|uniref:acyltransferase n=1 Tax=Neobacillus niacini TaxID=86668 RepID=UPI00285693E7|nr:acyltransferase [Neobacillus niacini]MDR7079132.1 maltose O-acetyltransferase [Neobacillus niacini]